MKNIIDIWNENNNVLPIKVARTNWKANGFAEIISIKEVQIGRNKRHEVLANIYGNIKEIKSNFSIKEDGLYKVNKYDYKNWYIVKNK